MYIEWLFAISSSIFLAYLAFLLLDRALEFSWYSILRDKLDDKVLVLFQIILHLKNKLSDWIHHNKEYISFWHFVERALVNLARFAHYIEKKLIKAAKKASSKRKPSNYLRKISEVKKPRLSN